MDEEDVRTTLTVAASAARVFAVLADPTTHAAIDGTGRVQDPADRAPLTAVGQVFRVDMHHPDHPDGHYRVANQVHVLDPPRAIGWRTGYDRGDGELEFGGWSWRYDLVPVGPSSTEVTLTTTGRPCRRPSASTCTSRRSGRSTSRARCSTWPSSPRFGSAGRWAQGPTACSV